METNEILDKLRKGLLIGMLLGVLLGVCFVSIMVLSKELKHFYGVEQKEVVYQTEGGSTIYSLDESTCIVAVDEYTVAKYQLDEKHSYVKILEIRGNAPEKITFDKRSLNKNDKVVKSFGLEKKLALSNCFKKNMNLIGQQKDSVKKILQQYGTVFEVSQNTYPEIMKDGIRYGLNLQNDQNFSTVFAYANDSGAIDSVQFIISADSGAQVANDFINIQMLEPNTKKASLLTFSTQNRFFRNNQNYIDVFYFYDGTLTIKYDINLENYIIYEFRTYGSMNQGFYGLFSTDSENVWADTHANQME